MQLHCLGTVGYHPNAQRHTSCYFLPESGLLLDAGTGVFRLAPLIQTDSLDVLLSHAHLDHTCGLTFLLDVLFESPVKTCRIWGEKDKLDAVRKHLFNDLIFPASLNAEWMEIDSLDEFRIGDTTITHRTQDHPGGSVAYRIEWQKQQKRLVYATDNTGDTSDEMAQWGQGCDLLMQECYFRDASAEWAKKTGHCWTSRVAEVAKLIQPKQLLVTHINPLETSEDPVDLDVIRNAVDCPVVLAEDEMTIEF
ncbi:MBL fold metallo-hydrolase [Novipirellula sp.]|uniref:MBL fold metallo-hydrolase n=1 Tax=Novipirellula sp. TaxID=2795430 RepID=UPI0035685E9C